MYVIHDNYPLFPLFFPTIFFLTCYLASFPADLFTIALGQSQAEFLLWQAGCPEYPLQLDCGSVEDQTNKASAPTKSTKSDPINQQNQMQKESNGYGDKYRLNKFRDSVPQVCVYKQGSAKEIFTAK
jgi:hypothetical protein